MSEYFVAKPKYITRGISNRLSLEMQQLLWEYIHVASNKHELDYLQVFEFEREGRKIKIIHKQEVPEFQEVHEIVVADNVNIPSEKVFAIDNGDHVTMLFASEY